jgi:hypothetical protein
MPIIEIHTTRRFDETGDCVGHDLYEVDVSILVDGVPYDRDEEG